MSTVLEKCVDITPNGVIRPWSLQDYRLIRVQPWWRKIRATTSWLRVWADWPTLQPRADLAPDDARSPGYGNLLAFDEQIRLAAADGLKVIVMPYRYPLWANDTARLDFNSIDNLVFLPQDRSSSAPFLRWYNSIGTASEGRNAELLRRAQKSREYHTPPEGHGPGSVSGTPATSFGTRPSTSPTVNYGRSAGPRRTSRGGRGSSSWPAAASSSRRPSRR